MSILLIPSFEDLPTNYSYLFYRMEARQGYQKWVYNHLEALQLMRILLIHNFEGLQ